MSRISFREWGKMMRGGLRWAAYPLSSTRASCFCNHGLLRAWTVHLVAVLLGLSDQIRSDHVRSGATEQVFRDLFTRRQFQSCLCRFFPLCCMGRDWKKRTMYRTERRMSERSCQVLVACGGSHVAAASWLLFYRPRSKGGLYTEISYELGRKWWHAKS